jgi:predicted O-methyltransferase YrrM
MRHYSTARRVQSTSVFSLDFWRTHSFTESWKTLRTVLAAGYVPWAIARDACYHQGAGQIRWEFARLVGKARSINPQVVLEIGVAAGGTLWAWPQISTAEATLIGLDINTETRSSLGKCFPVETVEARVRSNLEPGQKAHFVWGDSHDPSIRSRVLEILDGRKIDFLFIDGDHSYEGVKADFANFSPMVRNGGLIAFHDVVPDHMTRFGIPTQGYAGGVPLLWGELKQSYRHWEYIDDLRQDSCGIGVIEYRNAGAS